MGLGRAGLSKAKRAVARTTTGVCAIARIETRAGRTDEALALLSDMAFAVRAEEDGCVSYAVTRVLGSGRHIAVHARFATWQAFKDHAETAHMTRLLARLTPLMTAPVALEVFLEV